MSITFGPELIGRTEKALNAILTRELAATGVTEPRWVTLTLAVMRPGAIAPISEALKVDEATARRHLADLAALALVDPVAIEATPAGKALWDKVRSATTGITAG